ncbi:MAG: response regulator [Cyanobacteria bacterium SZAS LIN-5]|nr:response regulator [Cyanobacteria bacterium SZAS LIN-5]RTL44658.1 MAG: response regulator [Candidatus Melainabacteria bacterium]
MSADNKRILLVEDSPADARLILEVFKDEKIAADIKVVRDGQAALDCLRSVGCFADSGRPDLVILDLNIPKKDGREVLAEVKADENLKSIPVVILTTSQSEEDIAKSYRLQASCYVTKPIELQQFVKTIRSFDSFWLQSVRYPQNHE